MKKIILILLILPLSVFAKFFQGSITFNSGSTKHGFIEIPFHDDSKIKFKLAKKSETEKYEIEDVKSFEIINDENETLRYTTIFLSAPKLFGKTHLKIFSNKSWVRIIKEGKITVFAADYYERSGNGFASGLRYYVKKSNENFARFIRDKPNANLGVIINEYKAIVHYLKIYFETDCPKFVKAITPDDIKTNGMERIVDVYDQNCDE
jgi:hypothetical protein